MNFEEFSHRAAFGRTLTLKGRILAGGEGSFPTVTMFQPLPGIAFAMSPAHDSTDGGAVATASTAVTLVEDRELIALFVTRRDFAAFQALVERHGEMVLGACRRVLNHSAFPSFSVTLPSPTNHGRRDRRLEN